MEMQLQGSGSVSVSDDTFGQPFREALVHQVVTACLAGARAGTVGQKTRSEVSGGGAKPWRQKGTGRARHGSIRSPIWAGGGVTFGPQPRSYAQRTPKKVRRAALRAALSLRHQEGKVKQVKSIDLPEIKTRQIVEQLKKLQLEDVLIVTRERDLRLELAARNLPKCGSWRCPA